MSKIIPYGTQWIEEDDIEAVVEVLKSGFLTQGPKVLDFEKALAQYVGADFCVSFCNATAALHSAVASLEIPKGLSGITSPNTFVASSNCMIYNGLVPIFADIDLRTYNVTAESMGEAIDDSVKLLLPVHFAGQACDMASISKLAQKKSLKVIEDAAHAIGSTYADGSKVGNCRFSDMTVFSFHPVKTLTTGEGGAVTTNDPGLYKKLLSLRSHGIIKDPSLLSKTPGIWYYEQQDLGFNFRLTDMQCALGLSQLNKIDRNKKRRREIVNIYNTNFSGLKNLITPFESRDLDSCFHLYVCQFEFNSIGKSRSQVMAELNEAGVGSQVLYIPVYTHPWYRNNFNYSKICHNAETYYEKTLALPLFPRMTDGEVETVVNSVKRIIR